MKHIMTELRKETLTLPGANFNGVSSLPSISARLRLSPLKKEFELSEDDGLFIGYGDVDYIFPYPMQDRYDRATDNKEYTAMVLENRYLKAVFLPEFGAKLYSLYDKENKRNLLFTNNIVRPCNLATRNAWMSGGIEWNCGYIGHSPFTCDLVHTARTTLEDGTPVLRFYQYERIRSIVYQLDFFLPEDSHVLYNRVRIVNPTFEVVPMYWWSNIAAPDRAGNRVIVPADTSYTSRGHHPVKIDIPEYNGIDVTYPLDNVISIDYFWNIPDEERKFISIIDKSGYGLFQTSTKRLQGRKLFVWGNSRGGKRWKKFLTADTEDGSYTEIQAGIAKTQYECLPMPPNTAWEWLEAYGAIQSDPQAVHGDWNGAKNEIKHQLNKIVTEQDLEQLLQKTKKAAQNPAEEVIMYADGWGALENKRREHCGEKAMCPHLDFGKTSSEQQPWLRLLTNETLGEHDPLSAPKSYMLQAEWTQLMENSVNSVDKENWYTLYQLGLTKFIEKNYEKAIDLMQKSVCADKSPWALYALSIIYRDMDIHDKETEYISEALDMLPDDRSLATEGLRSYYLNEKYDEITARFEKMTDELKEIPRIRAYYAFALSKTGRIDEAEKLLYENGGLVVSDIREAETITLDLWKSIEVAKANCPTDVLDIENMDIPEFVDFRMQAKVEWLNDNKSKTHK